MVAAFSLGTEGLGSGLSIGEVKTVNPTTFTAHVYLRAGERKGVLVECTIRSHMKHDASKSGAIYMPDFGDLVYVDWRYGPTPMITGGVPQIQSPEVGTDFTTHVSPVRTFGGEDKFHSGIGDKNYRWGPTDLLPGDRMISARGGALLGVLAGGVAKLQASPLAQILLSKARDLVRIVSRNFEIFSDYGIMRMINNGGATSFELLGNSTGKKTNAHHESSWDYIFKIGGSELFDLSLKNLFRFRVDTDGAAWLTAKTATVDLQQPPQIRIRGDSQQQVDGHRSTTIGGDDWKRVSGTKTERMGRHAYVNSGARNEIVSGPHQGNYLGTHREVVRGTSLTSIDTVGKETRVAAGDYSIHIGDPLDLGVPAPLLVGQLKSGDYSLKTFSGDITLHASVKGNVELSTFLGDAELSTVAGDVTVNTGLGNLDLSTFAGDVDVSTLVGDVSLKTLLGTANVEATVGDVNITASAGSIVMTAGAYTFTVGPLGVSLDGPGGEFFSIINQALTALGTTTLTPGYGAPITNAAQFAALTTQLTLFQGVPA
jgi:hypothetical protein